MTDPAYIKSLEEKVKLLETKVKHLSNDLRLTREENEASLANYFELYSHMERNVEERTGDIRRLQKTLEQKGHELQMMLDLAPGIIFYKDPERRFVRVNKKYARLLDLPINDIIGKAYSDLFPQFRDNGDETELKVVQEGIPVLNKTEHLETPTGRRQIIIDRVPYKDINNRVSGLVGFALDVTDIKAAEQEKSQLEAQLHHAQRIESIGTLAGGIAHNFNNILMGILGHVSIMLMEKKPDDAHYENLKSIENQITSASELTRQLLGYAQEGRYELKTFDLNHLVRNTAKTFGMTKKDIRIHQDLAEDLKSIKADYGQIEQVLLNLLVNAADAMPRGGDLVLSTENVTHADMHSKPYIAKPGNYVLLTVKDSGVGMDEATMDRIFEPFFTTKGFARGTGLGLASTYGIIKGHGGYIDVSSEKGRGTTFDLYLPAMKAPAEKIEKGAAKDMLQGKERVLLVDDEATVVEVAEEMLKMLGYDVLLARNGMEAVSLYEAHHDSIDIVLLDMIMPEMGGGETYDRIKAIRPTAKVLLSSGYSIDGEATEILDRGCDGFIQKPFNLTDLSQRMREILEGKEAA
jgi:two-component system cell cycle sensor histidine kinase/response regulator CckA